MRPVLASVVVLLALPATASAQSTLPPLDYAAPTASISRGAPLTFAVRTAAPGGSVVVRVSGSATIDAEGLLTGPEDTWLDETATPAGEHLQVWSVPADSVLRQRPGHYYWQAYLTGEAANGAEEPIGPVQDLTVTLPLSDRGRGKLFPRYGRRSTGKSFYLSSADFPASIGGARFRGLARLTASRWGLKVQRWTSAKAGVQDGFNVAGFSADVAGGLLGVQTDYVKRGKVVESDLALRTDEQWAQGPEYPALDEVDLESVLLHELGHMAGNKKHRARCTNSPRDRGARRRRVVARVARQVVRRLLPRCPRCLRAQAACAPHRAHRPTPQADGPLRRGDGTGWRCDVSSSPGRSSGSASRRD